MGGPQRDLAIRRPLESAAVPLCRVGISQAGRGEDAAGRSPGRLPEGLLLPHCEDSGLYLPIWGPVSGGC